MLKRHFRLWIFTYEFGEASDGEALAGFRIDIDDDAAKADGAFGDGEAGGHAVAEAPDDGVDIAAEDGVGGAAHPGVC